MIVSTKGIGDITDTIDSFQTWSSSDYAIAGVVAFGLYLITRTTNRTYKKVTKVVKKHKSRSKKRKALKKELREL